jgi:hypothetical protein
MEAQFAIKSNRFRSHAQQQSLTLGTSEPAERKEYDRMKGGNRGKV